MLPYPDKPCMADICANIIPRPADRRCNCVVSGTAKLIGDLATLDPDAVKKGVQQVPTADQIEWIRRCALRHP